MAPQRLQLPASADLPHTWLAEALATLSHERLVVLPTETVYGIAARADSAPALERLTHAKHAFAARPWTWHVASAQALEAFGSTSASARRLARRYWPGPLTLVLPGVPKALGRVAHEGWTGVRCTAGEFSRALCEAAPFPLVMSSANRQGQAPGGGPDAFEDLELAPEDLILEGAGQALGESSSVLQLGQGRFELLREGLHDLSALRRAAGWRIAFACTGNTCRSPMAEGLARASIAKGLGCEPRRLSEFGFEVHSMGLFANPGAPAAEHATETLNALGLDISAHGAQQASPQLLNKLDAVYALTRGHLAGLQQMLPEDQWQRLQLLDPGGCDIADPIGGSAEVYTACAREIADAIEARLVEWV